VVIDRIDLTEGDPNDQKAFSVSVFKMNALARIVDYSYYLKRLQNGFIRNLQESELRD
jgi:hypothetical protein